MAQAKLGKVITLLSAPCYTKQYEYEYCVGLYLQGFIKTTDSPTTCHLTTDPSTT